MARTTDIFDVISDTTPFADYRFTPRQGRQKKRGIKLGIDRVFAWRYVGSSTTHALSVYVKQAIEAAGYDVYCLGGTTFVYSLLGVKKKTATLP